MHCQQLGHDGLNNGNDRTMPTLLQETRLEASAVSPTLRKLSQRVVRKLEGCRSLAQVGHWGAAWAWGQVGWTSAQGNRDLGGISQLGLMHITTS